MDDGCWGGGSYATYRVGCRSPPAAKDGHLCNVLAKEFLIRKSEVVKVDCLAMMSARTGEIDGRPRCRLLAPMVAAIG